MPKIDNCRALVDTGAAVCLVRQGLLPEHLFQKAVIPIRLWAVNNQRLQGGTQEVLLTLVLKGTQVETNREVELRLPTWFYAADIPEDLILSYEWCRLRGVDISARHHGLLCLKSGEEYWVDGIRGTQLQPSVMVPIIQASPRSMPQRCQEQEVPEILVTPPDEDQGLRALDLFSGTGSVTKVLQKLGYQVTTLDLDPKFHPDIQLDIRDWNFKNYPPGYFHLIAASPPCTHFSRAKTTGKRDLEATVCLVEKTLEVI